MASKNTCRDRIIRLMCVVSPNKSNLEAEASTHGKVDRRFQAGAEPPSTFL
ncbi:MAG: hypothetical protein ICV54_30510 [Nostoc sp. C3-bin3]|nr:hypothetical protein [Nostoc sp. C3-bin3]